MSASYTGYKSVGDKQTERMYFLMFFSGILFSGTIKGGFTERFQF